MKNPNFKEFCRFSFKIMIAHTITYLVFGLIMSHLFDYEKLFTIDIIKNYMRPFGSEYILAGPFLQPVRGLLFAIGLWPVRELFFKMKNGWLPIWGLLVIFGIFNTPAAAPCSIEGVIYSRLPLWYHLLGLPEIILQTLAFSVGSYFWCRKDLLPAEEKKSSRLKTVFARLLEAVSLSCFAYIGYAAGSIVNLFLSGMTLNFGNQSKEVIVGNSVNITAAGSNIAIQLMFVVAFVANVILVYYLKRVTPKKPFRFWQLFLICYVVDTIVPFIYQVIFLGIPPLHQALFLGLLPGLIIAGGVKEKNISTQP